MLGRGFLGHTLTPPDGTFTSIAAGRMYSCALTSEGRAVCWGHNTFDRTEAADVTFASIATGPDHLCALTPGGRAVCWGNNTTGEADAPEGTLPLSPPVWITRAPSLLRDKQCAGATTPPARPSLRKARSLQSQQAACFRAPSPWESGCLLGRLTPVGEKQDRLDQITTELNRRPRPVLKMDDPLEALIQTSATTA